MSIRNCDYLGLWFSKSCRESIIIDLFYERFEELKRQDIAEAHKHDFNIVPDYRSKIKMEFMNGT